MFFYFLIKSGITIEMQRMKRNKQIFSELLRSTFESKTIDEAKTSEYLCDGLESVKMLSFVDLKSLKHTLKKNRSWRVNNNQNKMLANTNPNFEALITQLMIDRRYQKAIKWGNSHYQISALKIGEVPPHKIAEMYYVISTKFYFNRAPETQEGWHENELRVFSYLLIGYSFLHAKTIDQMTEEDWKFFSQIFNNRDTTLFEFQALSMSKKTCKTMKWSTSEISLLDQIIKTKSIKNKWSETAKQLFIRSGKNFFKTSKQCREYWINHLDPVTVRSAWTIEDDLELILAVLKVGKKWSKVSKIMGRKRTEHMVKNRFKSLYNSEAKSTQNPKSQEQILHKLVRKFKAIKEDCFFPFPQPQNNQIGQENNSLNKQVECPLFHEEFDWKEFKVPSYSTKNIIDLRPESQVALEVYMDKFFANDSALYQNIE